jgi:hypothetical protein
MTLDNNSSLGLRKRRPSLAQNAPSMIFPVPSRLTVVATDRVWADYPGNVTNMADVIANGDSPNIRARITWVYPAALDPAATAVEVMLYKQATDRHAHTWPIALPLLASQRL